MSRSSDDRKPLLLGEMPSEKGDRFHGFPLSGAPAKRIVSLLQLKPEDPADKGQAAYWTLRETFRTRNAQHRYAPKFDLPAAREAWRLWQEAEEAEDPGGITVVVCIGRRAQLTVGQVTDQWGIWTEAASIQVAAMPHTSGRNRLWNDPDTAERAELVLREALLLAGPDDGYYIDEHTGRVAS